MPVQAVPGGAASAPSAPVATRTAGPAATPASGRAGDPVDVVSLSPAAQMRQALDVPALALRQLGVLLGEFEQIAGLARSPAPLVLGALAGEIGASARSLGAGVQALLPTPDAPTPLQLGAAAALRVLTTQAAARTAPPDARAQDPPVRDDHAPGPWGPAAAPAGTLRPGVTPPGAEEAGPEPRDTLAPDAPGSGPAPSSRTALPEAGSGEGADAPWPVPRDAADPGATPAPTTRAASAPPAAPASASTASATIRPAPARAAHARPAATPAGPARPDPVRQLRDAALVLLREAAATLGRAQLRPRAAPAQPDRTSARAAEASRDEAWCDAQIAAALGSVAHASQALSGARPAAWPGIAAAFGLASTVPGQTARSARTWTRLALPGCLAAALWATQSLDLGFARALTAVALGAGAVAWGWRKAAGRRVRIELR